jgi:SAM-dependent methyltransferase
MRARQFYLAHTEDGASINGRIRKAADVLLQHAPRPQRFLDIGCGAGVATRYIADTIGASHAFGVDLADPAAARGRGVEACEADLEADHLPFDDRSIDAIHCGEVLEHLVDTDHLMDEIRRLLAPRSGVCVLTTPNLAAWHNRAALLFGFQPFLSQVSFRYAPGRAPMSPGEGGGHLRMFTHRALIEFIRCHGFEILESRGIGIFELGDPQGSRGIKRLAMPIDRLFSAMPSLACDVLVAFRRGDA